jgi:hypothetical protein
MHPVLVVLLSWVAAQPALCAAWAFALRGRRAAGGN